MGIYKINGGRKLSGKFEPESAKNSVLALVAAATLTDEEVVIRYCPLIDDVKNILEILSYLGINTHFEKDALIIHAQNRKGFFVPENLCEKLRASTYMMGALLSTYGKAVLGYPGGCKIGQRPLDIHLDGLIKTGVNVAEKEGRIYCERIAQPFGKYLLKYPSFGATVNLILASVIGKGRVILQNVAREPEIQDLCNFLNSMGAKISGAGTCLIEIQGVNKLFGTEYFPISDRIETGTYLLAAAITRGEIEIKSKNVKNIQELLNKILINSCNLLSNNDIIYINFNSIPKGFDISTGPFPKFPTDLQSQTLAYLTLCKGKSIVAENVFDNRFSCVSQLTKMGANITLEGNMAIISGVERLVGCDVWAGDLRSGSALVLAGLSAQGETNVYDVEYLKRGYLNMVSKLNCLGADITEIF